MSVVETDYLAGTRLTVTGEMLNKFACISKTGTNIPLIPLSVGVPLVKCQEDGSIYKSNRLYLLRDDVSGYDPVFPMHTHDPDDEFNEGGSYYAIKALNSYHLLDFNNQSFTPDGWKVEADTGTESATVEVERLNGSLYTKGTSVDDAGEKRAWNMFRGGLRLDFSYPMMLTGKMVLSHDTALVLRYGCNLDPVHNTAGLQNQIGIEGCTSASANFEVVSGNGGLERTGLALPNASLSYGSPKGYNIEWIPGDRIIFSDSLGNEVTKDDALPSLNSGTDGDTTLILGLVTSDNIDKILKMFASHLLGKIYDTRSGIDAWA